MNHLVAWAISKFQFWIKWSVLGKLDVYVRFDRKFINESGKLEICALAYELFLLSCYFKIRLKLWWYKTIQGKYNLLTTNLMFIWFVSIGLYTSAAWSSPLNNTYCYVLGDIEKMMNNHERRNAYSI